MSDAFRVTLRIWRQASAADGGRFVSYEVDDVQPDMSFLEVMDRLNNRLEAANEEPVAFDHDCREGICGACGLYINGQAHGPRLRTTTCQLSMRHFRHGDMITVEPWRAAAFPVLQDLIVDRSAFDRIIQAGGFVSVHTGQASEANSVLVDARVAEQAFEAAACIGCGACVAACKNASASLFVGAKVSHLSLLPPGDPERHDRALNMTAAAEAEGFGHCTNTGQCQEACPKGISIGNIVRMNREFLCAWALTRLGLGVGGGRANR